MSARSASCASRSTIRRTSRCSSTSPPSAPMQIPARVPDQGPCRRGHRPLGLPRVGRQRHPPQPPPHRRTRPVRRQARRTRRHRGRARPRGRRVLTQPGAGQPPAGAPDHRSPTRNAHPQPLPPRLHPSHHARQRRDRRRNLAFPRDHRRSDPPARTPRRTTRTSGPTPPTRTTATLCICRKGARPVPPHGANHDSSGATLAARWRLRVAAAFDPPNQPDEPLDPVLGLRSDSPCCADELPLEA